jgi:hypothetical protein
MAYAPLRDFAPSTKPHPPKPRDEGLSSAALYRPLESLLVGGGDARLALSRAAQCNVYGCTPWPRPALIDFASSTASGISQAGYARAGRARMRLLADAAREGLEPAFEHSVEKARAWIRRHFALRDVEIVFAPSGTDAQLQALFLAKALLGAPLVSIVMGADQTGRGTAHTARGRHFSSRTAQGAPVTGGVPISGLGEGLQTIEIPFCDAQGRLRGVRDLDDLLTAAIESAIRRGAKVLLQALDSSKLGWRAPSLACLAAIAARWPQHVRVVVDACQMRLGAARLRDYLAQGFAVLMTGSKYFTGPPFSGALLIPAAWAEDIDAVHAVPPGLAAYSNRFDWPRRWPLLRRAFAPVPNYGQWLRWEAALAEMRAYFAVPADFRDAALAAFAQEAPRLIGASGHLVLLPGSVDNDAMADEGDDEMRHRSIFAFVPQRGGRALTPAACDALYRALGRDLSSAAPLSQRAIASRLCQVGQPVLLGHRPGAALRLCASARLVRQCWEKGAVDASFAPLAAVVRKIEWLLAQPELPA